MFCVFFFFFFFIGVYPNVYLYSSLPVLPVLPVQCPLYIYRYSSECPIGSTSTRYRDTKGLGPHPSFHRWGCPFPSLPPRFTLYPSPLPALRSHAAPGMGGAPPIRPCYHQPTPRPDAVGLDPRVCVHPTVLPPKKISCHLIWLSSTSSVVNLK